MVKKRGLARGLGPKDGDEMVVKASGGDIFKAQVLGQVGTAVAVSNK